MKTESTTTIYDCGKKKAAGNWNALELSQALYCDGYWPFSWDGNKKTQRFKMECQLSLWSKEGGTRYLEAEMGYPIINDKYSFIRSYMKGNMKWLSLIYDYMYLGLAWSPHIDDVEQVAQFIGTNSSVRFDICLNANQSLAQGIYDIMEQGRMPSYVGMIALVASNRIRKGGGK